MPQQKDKNQKIAIIGAGIAGLTAAHTLRKKGYSNITIFEAEDRAGGKIWTKDIGGLPYELGANFFAIGASTIEKLVKEYKIPVTGRSLDAMVYSAGEQIPQMKYLSKFGGMFKLMSSHWRFLRLTLKYRRLKTPGYKAEFPELNISMKEYFENNKIEAMLPMFEILFQGWGYGYADSIPALYLMKIVTASSLKNSITFTIYQNINNLFGTNLPVIRTFDRGFQHLLNEMAKTFNVRLNSKVTRVKREKSGVDFKINITVNEKTETFDRIIISSLPAHTMRYLDMDAVEREIFENVKYTNYQVVTFSGKLPLKSFALYFGRNDNIDRNGYPVAMSRPHKENNIFQAWHLHDGTLSNGQVEDIVRGFTSDLGGKLEKVFFSVSFLYFPHFDKKGLGELKPYLRLENRQGDNGTYYIGGLLNIEGTEQSAQYAEYLMNKHF